MSVMDQPNCCTAIVFMEASAIDVVSVKTENSTQLINQNVTVHVYLLSKSDDFVFNGMNYKRLVQKKLVIIVF